MAGFHEIIGHEQLIAHLQSAIVMDKVSHAYIINGPKDSGKMMLAQAFAMRCSVRLPSGTGRERQVVQRRNCHRKSLQSHVWSVIPANRHWGITSLILFI